MSPIKTIKNNNNQYRITAVLKISTYIITSITAHPVGLAAILAKCLSRPSKLPLFYIDLMFMPLSAISQLHLTNQN